MNKVLSSTQRIINRIIAFSNDRKVDDAIDLFRRIGYIKSSSGVVRPSHVTQRLVHDSIINQGLDTRIDDSIMRSIHILSR